MYREITTTNKTITKQQQTHTKPYNIGLFLCPQIYVSFVYTKDEAIKILINFWNKWGHTRERPLFIDAHLNIED